MLKQTNAARELLAVPLGLLVLAVRRWSICYGDRQGGLVGWADEAHSELRDSLSGWSPSGSRARITWP
jgi:hypothetical protein